MAFRADILAGRAVILVSIQDTVDRQLRGIRNKLFAFSNSMQKIGRDLTLFGAAGTVGAFFPVREFTTFQDSMLFVQTKLRDTGVDVQALEKHIRELGRTTTFTSKEVAEAAAVLAQAGLGPKVQPTLLPTLDLARGARIDLETAGRILANTMSAFDIQAERADEVASKLITAARLGTTDVVLLGESLKESLTTFRQLGVPLEDALGLFSQLSNVSLRATKAGTSLNTAFANLASKADQLAEFGIVIDEGDLEEPVRILRKLQVAFREITNQEQVSALQSLFNIRGGRGFGGLLVQDLEDLDRIINTIKESSDEARESALLMDSQLGGVGRRLRSAFQEALITIGATTEGPLTDIGEQLREVFNNLGQMAQRNPKFVQTLLLIPPAALAVGASLLGLSLIAGRLGLIISPLIGLNNLFFASLKRIASVNIAGLQALGGLALSPGRRVAARVSADEAAVLKAQQRIARATRATDITKGIRAAKAADAARSIFTRPIPAAKIFLDMIQRISKALSGSPFRVGPGIQRSQGLAGAAGPLLGRSLFGSGGPARIGQSPFSPFGPARLGFSPTSTPDIDNIRKAAQQQMIVYRNALTRASRGPTGLPSIIDGKVVARTTATTRQFSKMGGFLQLIGRGISGLTALFTKLLSAGRTVGRSLLNVDYVRILFRTFKGLGSAFKGFFSILNGIRRFAFSASGVLTIIEFLILAGPKIPPIKRALDALGAGISDFFQRLGQTRDVVAPFFADLLSGFRELATGNIDAGLIKVKNSLKSIGEIISAGLTLAWNDFMDNVQKGINFMVRSFQGLKAILSGIGQVFSSTVETAFRSTGGTTGPQETGDGVSIIEAIVSSTLGFLEVIGEAIIRAVEVIRTILLGIADVVLAISRNIANSRLFGSPEARVAVDEAERRMQAASTSDPARFMQISKQLADLVLSTSPTATAAEISRGHDILAGRGFEETRQRLIAEMDKMLGVTTTTEKPLQAILTEMKEGFRRIFDRFVNESLPQADVEGAEAGLTEAERRANARANTTPPLLGFDVANQLAPIFTDIAGKADTDIRAIMSRSRMAIDAMKKDAAAQAELERRLAGPAGIAKALVGSFDQVQGQKLQAITKEANKVRDELLGKIHEEMAEMNDNKVPFVFG